MKPTITAILPTYDRVNDLRVDIHKTFDVELRANGHIYSPELIRWVNGHKDRLTNLITVEYTTDRKHSFLYSV